MKIKIIACLIILLFPIYSLYSSDCKPSKTVYGDCNGQDQSKWYQSKTYIDGDCDGKYDTEYIVWCNGKTTTRPYKGMVTNPQFDPGEHSIHSLEYMEYNQSESDIKFRFNIKDSDEGPILAYEEKEFENDTIYLYVLIPLIYFGYDNDKLKIMPFSFYNDIKKQYILQYYDEGLGNTVIKIWQYNPNKLLTVKSPDNGKGWKLITINMDDFSIGKYYIQVNQKEIWHTTEVINVQ